MGLQSNSLNLVSQTHKYLSQIHQMSHSIRDSHSQRAQSSPSVVKSIRKSSGLDSKLIGKLLSRKLDAVKEALKRADVKKQGLMEEKQLASVFSQFGVAIPDYSKFYRGGEVVDYIKLLKYYL